MEFGTDAWARTLCEALNGSSEYRNAAARWGQGFNGTVMLTFEADGKLPRTLHLLVRLEAGRCLGAEFVDRPDHPEAAWALQAAFAVWKDILDGRSLAATQILAGRLRVRGDKMTLLKHAAAHRALLSCVSALDTRYPVAG